MTRREVSSRILNVVNQKPELTLPASAVNSLTINAKQELLTAVNEWVTGGTADRAKGALFLLQTSGVISEPELENLTDLIEDAE